MTEPRTCKQCEADIYNETDEHYEGDNVFCSDGCLRQWNTEAEIERAEQLYGDDLE